MDWLVFLTFVLWHQCTNTNKKRKERWFFYMNDWLFIFGDRFYSTLPLVGQSWQRSTEGHTGSWLGHKWILEPRDPAVRRQQAFAGCCQTVTTSVSLISNRHHWVWLTHPRIHAGTSKSSLQYRPITPSPAEHARRSVWDSSPDSSIKSRYSKDCGLFDAVPPSYVTATRSECTIAALATSSCSVRTAMMTKKSHRPLTHNMWALVLDTCNLIHRQFNSREVGLIMRCCSRWNFREWNRVYVLLLASDSPLVFNPVPVSESK